MRNVELKKVLIFICIIVGTVLLIYGTARSSDVTLKWNAPTTSADGSPLEDLAGYIVYTKNTEGNFVQIGRTVQTQYLVEDAAEGQCFSVTAYDLSNLESKHSNVSCVGIPPAMPSISCATVICNHCVITNCTD